MAIKNCDCKHPMQDKMHGPGKRVMNPMARQKGSDSQRYRCTVCLRERT